MLKRKPTFITIINDCQSENDIGRQNTRWSVLFSGVNVNFVGVDSSLGINSTLEAAGNLIDILDSSDGEYGIIAINVAPRGEIEKDGNNGSPFAYFWYKKVLVVSTIKGYNLSLVKKLALTDQIKLLDTESVLKVAEQNNLIDKQLNSQISKTQFRSFNFQPRVSRWLWDKKDVPSSKLDISCIPDAPDVIWYIDSFGNYKTTLLQTDLIANHPKLVSGFNSKEIFDNKKITQSGQVRHSEGGFATEESLSIITTNLGKLPYYDRLKDVPSGETAIYTGSSGIEDKRFLEIAKQNSPGSAHKEFAKEIGFEIKVV